MTYQITDPASGSTFLSTGAQATQTTVEVQNVTGSNQQNASLSFTNTTWIAFKFFSGAGATSQNWQTVTAWITAQSNSADTSSFQYLLYSDSAGVPGTQVAACNGSQCAALTTTTTPTAWEEVLQAPWTPANSTYYWLIIHTASAVAGTYAAAYDNSTGSGLVATSSNSGSTWSTISGTGCLQLGQGTSHSFVGNTTTAHVFDATTVTGIGVYAQCTGPLGNPAWFVIGPSGRGVYIDGSAAGVTDYLLYLRKNGAPAWYVDPTGFMYVAGPTQMQGMFTAVRTVTANYTCPGFLDQATDYTIFVNSSSKTITLPNPTIAGGGRIICIKNLSGITGTTVTATSGNVEGGATDTTTLASALAFATYQAIGGNWWRVG